MLAVALEGNVSMRLGEPNVVLRGALSRETDAGLEVVGGQLALASALALEVVIEAFEDARLERDEDPPTGLSLWKGERTPGIVARGRAPAGAPPAPVRAPPAPASSVPAAPAPAPTAAASPAPTPAAPASPLGAGRRRLGRGRARAAAPGAKIAHDELDDAILEPKGDWVEHRQFGLCRVDGERTPRRARHPPSERAAQAHQARRAGGAAAASRLRPPHLPATAARPAQSAQGGRCPHPTSPSGRGDELRARHALIRSVLHDHDHDLPGERWARSLSHFVGSWERFGEGTGRPARTSSVHSSPRSPSSTRGSSHVITRSAPTLPTCTAMAEKRTTPKSTGTSSV